MNLDQCINFLLTGAQHKVFQELKKELEQYDLTPIQYGVLKCIWQLDLHTPKEIADYLSVENSTISGILDRMEKKNLIERKIDRDDRRYVYIDLTKTGKELEDPVNKTIEDFNKAALSDFSDAEAETLRALLKRLFMSE